MCVVFEPFVDFPGRNSWKIYFIGHIFHEYCVFGLKNIPNFKNIRDYKNFPYINATGLQDSIILIHSLLKKTA